MCHRHTSQVTCLTGTPLMSMPRTFSAHTSCTYMHISVNGAPLMSHLSPAHPPCHMRPPFQGRKSWPFALRCDWHTLHVSPLTNRTCNCHLPTPPSSGCRFWYTYLQTKRHTSHYVTPVTSTPSRSHSSPPLRHAKSCKMY
jgi:hypothetical protein